MKMISHAAAALILCTAGSADAFAEPLYHVTYLGFSFTNGVEAKLNNLDQVVGSDGDEGFIYDHGQIIPLGSLGGLPFMTRPRAINDAGQVAGSSSNAADLNNAFLYANGKMSDVGPFKAFGINSAGDVVGGTFLANGNAADAFLYHNGVTSKIGAGIATAINAAGVVVGNSPNYRAVRYENGSAVDLGDFGESSLTRAADINDLGQIVGTSSVQTEAGYYINHPFLYESGSWHDLGLPAGVPLGIPVAINNAGQIVGNSNESLGSSDRPPFFYSGETIYNLQSLLDSSGLGLHLQLAYDINDHGVILAQGHDADDYRAVLLTPVPESTTFALANLGALSLLAHWLRSRRHLAVLQDTHDAF